MTVPDGGPSQFKTHPHATHFSERFTLPVLIIHNHAIESLTVSTSRMLNCCHFVVAVVTLPWSLRVLRFELNSTCNDNDVLCAKENRYSGGIS